MALTLTNAGQKARVDTDFIAKLGWCLQNGYLFLECLLFNQKPCTTKQGVFNNYWVPGPMNNIKRMLLLASELNITLMNCNWPMGTKLGFIIIIFFRLNSLNFCFVTCLPYIHKQFHLVRLTMFIVTNINVCKKIK